MSVLAQPTTYPESLGSDCHGKEVYELDGVLFCKSCGMPCDEVFDTEEEDDELSPEEREDNERANEADFKCDSERDMRYE